MTHRELVRALATDVLAAVLLVVFLNVLGVVG